VCFGGNALIREGQKGTVYEQFANTRESLEGVVELIRRGHKIVLTHGNGPQVGNIVIRTEEAEGKAYYIPLGVAVAESQGEIGYMIEQSLQNKLMLEKINKKVATVLTQVICDKDDASIKTPTKPIGPFYGKEKLDDFKEHKIKFVEDSGRGYRRVVPSPIPLETVEREIIKKLVDSGIIVIACGGGGMPVYVEKDGRLEGIDGVIDKDLASAVLATEIQAEEMHILTSVEKVALNYNKPNQKFIDKMTIKEAKKYMKEGHFPSGSMRPKIQASIDFLEKGGKRVVITSINKLVEGMEGSTGTEIVK